MARRFLVLALAFALVSVAVYAAEDAAAASPSSGEVGNLEADGASSDLSPSGSAMEGPVGAPVAAVDSVPKAESPSADESGAAALELSAVVGVAGAAVAGFLF